MFIAREQPTSQAPSGAKWDSFRSARTTLQLTLRFYEHLAPNGAKPASRPTRPLSSLAAREIACRSCRARRSNVQVVERGRTSLDARRCEQPKPSRSQEGSRVEPLMQC